MQQTDQFTFVANSLMTGKIERFETMFADLQTTFIAVEELLTDPKHDSMSDRVQRIYGDCRTKTEIIKRKIYIAIGKINLNAGANIDKFKNAFKAYANCEGFVPGKYARQLKRLQISEPLPEPWVSYFSIRMFEIFSIF